VIGVEFLFPLVPFKKCYYSQRNNQRKEMQQKALHQMFSALMQGKDIT
jgi:hypothetical protein